jgi:hypothetical protein
MFSSARQRALNTIASIENHIGRQIAGVMRGSDIS